jgi:uncharacterized protein YlzI (FlbEa/FlbD family)
MLLHNSSNLNEFDGQRIQVRREAIESVAETPAGVFVTLTNGQTFHVQESFRDVCLWADFDL